MPNFRIVRKIDLLLLLIIAIAIFFRFFNFTGYQYWNTDDELMSALIRHIVWDKSPILLVPDIFLEIGFGPYFVWLISPFYFLLNFSARI